MTIKEVTEILEAAWPLRWQEPYDNAGLAVGSPDTTVTGILIAVDATDAVLDEAISEKCNLIVTHHPAIFRGLKQLTDQSLVARAIRHRVALYAAHTNLDSAPDGLSYALAERLGLKHLKTLAPIDSEHGMGVIGLTDDPGFFDKLPRPLRHSALPAHIKKVALCTGSGADLIDAARAAQADLYITADLKYHDFADAGAMAVVDIGHFESESHAIELIHAQLSKKITTFAVRKSAKSTNPVNYK